MTRRRAEIRICIYISKPFFGFRIVDGGGSGSVVGRRVLRNILVDPVDVKYDADEEEASEDLDRDVEGEAEENRFSEHHDRR
jgi:hypothetical protein